MPSLICFICGPRSWAHKTRANSNESTIARISVNFFFIVPPWSIEQSQKDWINASSVKLFDMFSGLPVKALEQSSILELPHNTLIHEVAGFFVLEARFRRELFDSECYVLGFWERTLRDCPLHVGPVHKIQYCRVVDA